MSDTRARQLDTGRRGDLLFIGLVVAAYVTAFMAGWASFSLPEVAVLIAAGVVYVFIGIYGNRFCLRLNSSLALAAYFVVQIVLGGLIFYWSRSQSWLILLPLVGQAVEALPRRWMAVTCALNLAIVVAIHSSYISTAVSPTGKLLYPLFSKAFWTIIVQSAVQYLAAIAFVVLFTQVAVRERDARAEVERLAAELGEANVRLREYAAQAEELATVKERNRLARDIHDGLGHYLTAIHVQIQAGRAVLDRDRATALDALSKAQSLAQAGLSEVRRSVAALRASPLDNRSLPEAVLELVDECRAAGVATEFKVCGELRPLSAQVELALYRAVQEALTNVRKHADASRAEVTLDCQSASLVRLTVHDYGLGSGDLNGGFGLLGIRERVRLLGGQVHVDTAPGAGFTLQVEVPIP